MDDQSSRLTEPWYAQLAPENLVWTMQLGMWLGRILEEMVVLMKQSTFYLCAICLVVAPSWANAQFPGSQVKATLTQEELAEKKQKLYLLRNPGDPIRLDIKFGNQNTAGPDVNKPTAQTFPWAKFISPGTLEKEISLLTTQNQEHLANSGVFVGKGFKKIRDNYAVAASLFQVASQYDGNLKYKEEGAGLRDLLASIPMKIENDDAKPDDAMYAEAQLGQQALEKLAAGSKAGVANGPPRKGVEVTPDKAIMRRMELAQDRRIRGWTASADDFSKNAENIQHEAELLAVMCQIIMDKSYPTAEGEDYQGWAKQLQQDCIDIVAAVKSKNHDAASKASSDMLKQCSACHEGYR